MQQGFRSGRRTCLSLASAVLALAGIGAGFAIADAPFQSRAFECEGCPNLCEVVETIKEERVIDRYGDRCGKWSEI